MFLAEKLIVQLQRMVRLERPQYSLCKTEMSDFVFLIEKYLLLADEKITTYVHLVRLHDLSLMFESAICVHQLDMQMDSECASCRFRLVLRIDTNLFLKLFFTFFLIWSKFVFRILENIKNYHFYGKI